MRNHLGSKPFITLALFLGISACSNTEKKLPGQESMTQILSPDNSIAPPPPADDSGNNPSANNSLNATEILKSIYGMWSSNCRDLHNDGIANSSEKDLFLVQNNIFSMHTLHYSNSRNCELKFYQKKSTVSFSYKAQAGEEERKHALAIDLIDEKLKIESPKFSIILLAQAASSSKKGRILFEILDNDRAGLRLHIEEWQALLPQKMKGQGDVLTELQNIANASDMLTGRNIPYTKSQAYSRSSKEDVAALLKNINF